MKEASPEQVQLRFGKGVVLPLTGSLVEILAAAMEQINTLWEACDTPLAFFRELPWENFEEDSRYGTKKWISYQISNEGDEFRVVVACKNDRVRIDFREYYVPH